MPFKGTPGRGGKRPGAGRKPKAATLLKLKLAEHGADEAEKSFSWLCTWRDDDAVPVAVRKECAIEIMNRVLGKPKQPITGDAADPLRIVIEYADIESNPAAPAPGAVADQTGA